MSLSDTAAKLGALFPVFPCAENKRPIVKDGFKAASQDAKAIKAAFSRPGAELIGMPTGAASGIIAIDIDIRDGYSGKDWLDINADALPPTKTHKTRSGGLHLLFRAPADIEIRNSAGRIALGVDVRGEGGYIIIPPSAGYQVADPTDYAEMPRWLIRACCKPEPQPQPVPAEKAAPRADGGSRYGLRALEQECDAIRTAHFGQQEQTLNNAALKIGALVSGGELSESVALADLMVAGRGMASQGGRKPWTDNEVEAKIRRAFSTGMSAPRKAPPSRPTASSEPPPHMEFDQGYYDSLERDSGRDSEPGGERDSGGWDDAAAEPAPELDPKQQKQDLGLPLVLYQDIQPSLDTMDFVEGLLDERSSSVLYGESNSGKTFFATDLALHIAAGNAWRDREVEQGGVVYAALEGSAGFNNRISAWRNERGDGTIPFAAIPCALNLLHPDADTSRLIAAIHKAAEAFAIPVKLVVIDTLSRALAGGNENASEDMGALVTNMDRIRAETGAAVMFIHHTGKDASKGARGHSILRAAIETEIEVGKSEGSNVRVARVVKQREMETTGLFEFELKVVELGQNRRGKPVTTCLVEHLQGDGTPEPRKPTGHAQTAYRLICDLVAESGLVHHASFNQPSVPEDWWRDRFYERAMPGGEQDTRKRAFRRAADMLVQSGRVGFNRGRVWVVKK